MSKSTPITQLSGNEEDASNTNPAIVQDILNEIQQQEEVPIQRQPIMEEPPHNMSTANYQMDAQVMHQMPVQQEVEQPNIQMTIEEPKTTMMTTILDNIKDPATVSLFAFILSLPMVNTVLLKYVPKISSISGGMNYLGLLLKALVIGVLFFTTKKLLN